MAEKLIVNRDIYLSHIVATDGELAMCVGKLEATGGEMTFEELDKATDELENKAKGYGLSLDEMNRVYELIRDSLARAASS